MAQRTYRNQLFTEEVRLFICDCIENGWSKSAIAQALGCSHTTFNRLLIDFNIWYEGTQGYTNKTHHSYVPLEQYLKESKKPQTYMIHRKLLYEGYKDAVCENCGRREWMNAPIPLELHHKDGNHLNVSIDNFQLLCPNCHALTNNFKGKGKRSNQFKAEVVDFNLDCIKSRSYGEVVVAKPTEHSNNKCQICGAQISCDATYCMQCSHHLQRKCEWPSQEELRDLICQYPILQIAKRYGVSDNAVRKWCKNYGLPSNKQELKKYLIEHSKE